MSELETLKRRIERERQARELAEAQLEKTATELSAANEQLRDLADQTNVILETAAEAIVTYDESGKIRMFNRSAQRIFCCRDGVCSNIRDLFEPSDATEAALFPSAAVESIAPSYDRRFAISEPVELRAYRSANETFICELSLSQSEHRGTITFTALVRDLSRRKQLEARLHQAQKMESVGQLAAGIAHEINTPIQFIGNNIQFMQGAFEDLVELLDLYGQLVAATKNNTSLDSVVAEIDQQSELVDLPFLRQEFPSAIRLIS